MYSMYHASSAVSVFALHCAPVTVVNTESLLRPNTSPSHTATDRLMQAAVVVARSHAARRQTLAVSGFPDYQIFNHKHLSLNPYVLTP